MTRFRAISALSRIALLTCSLLGSAGCFERMALSRDVANTALSVESEASAGDDEVVRFFAIGDAGARAEGASLATSTKTVAALVAEVCRAKGGCDFGVFLGDNVYETGISDADDETYLENFVALFRRATSGFLYFVLGNHDYHPYFPSTQRAEKELAAIRKLAPKGVRGRNHFFEFASGPVALFAWDTNYLVHNCDAWMRRPVTCALDGLQELAALRNSKAAFRIWLGHHPYRSNGEHGNAGDFNDAGFTLWPGEGLRSLFEQYVVGSADLMLSGHDHNLQVFADPNLSGTAAVVSGAGGKSSGLRPIDERQPAWFERDNSYGFALVEATPQSLCVEIYALAVEQVLAARPPKPQPLFRLCKAPHGPWQKR